MRVHARRLRLQAHEHLVQVERAQVREPAPEAVPGAVDTGHHAPGAAGAGDKQATVDQAEVLRVFKRLATEDGYLTEVLRDTYKGKLNEKQYKS